MKPRERRTYWRAVTRIQLVLQAKYSSRIKTVLDKGVKEFIEKVKTGQRSMDVELWNEDLLTVFIKMYRETVIKFANIQYRNLAKQSKNYQKNMGFKAQWTQEVNDWLARYGLQLVTTITQSEQERLLDIVNQQIQEGVTEGYGVDVVTRNIVNALNVYMQTNRYIAERIARTETMRAANIGHMKGANAHGFQVRKEWISAKDGRTRRYEKDDFDHWILDGQQREMDEPFMQISKSGKVANAMQPGDGPPGFSINCRCTIAFEPKRDSNGKLIKK